MTCTRFLAERRRLLATVGGLACAPGLSWSRTPDSGQSGPLQAEALAIERETGGRVGAALHDPATGRRVAWRGDERFAMCSTFKLLLAAAVLAEVDRGRLRLDDPVRFGAADLVPYAPVVEPRLSAGVLSVGELCAAAVEVSDNAAANLLLARIGGPAGLTRFVRGVGDGATRLDRTEPALNSNKAGDPRDTTTPSAMAATAARLATGDRLSAAARRQWTDWLVGCRTGAKRLRAGVPAGWTVGDKTGTGSRGAVNDVALVWPPGRGPLVLAVYLSGSQLPAEALEAAHARLARAMLSTVS